MRAQGGCESTEGHAPHIALDADAMLDEAVKRGRAGGAFARTWRAISGQGVGAVVAPDVQYSRRAVQRMVDRVRVAVGRKALDAKVDFKPQAVTIRQAGPADRSTR